MCLKYLAFHLSTPLALEGAGIHVLCPVANHVSLAVSLSHPAGMPGYPGFHILAPWVPLTSHTNSASNSERL